MNLTTLSIWTNARYTFELVYSRGARTGKPFGVIRKKDGARIGEYVFEADAKLALYELGAVPTV